MIELQKLGRLSLHEFFLLVVSTMALPVVAMLLKYRGFRRTEQLLSRFSRGPISVDATEKVHRAARMVSIAAHKGPFNAQCLEQAITLWWMLGLVGIETTIRMGIYKRGDAVEAHAWVLYQEEIVLGELERLSNYTPLLDVNIERPK
ncbi:MAG: lasso peptide biosynthesis B2 protein [Pseudomonadales bacterium]|nr:lasso peptide biosynthesis B2 protein [Pseudomonadales bacterium]MBO6700905.1 lasso peptide biosynthesis B2 protein [Pseudomonadales bacterium]MBO7005931.1 lasso peptide biosynthesis B2 protein [Pseudomonadales bacterium]